MTPADKVTRTVPVKRYFLAGIALIGFMFYVGICLGMFPTDHSPDSFKLQSPRIISDGEVPPLTIRCSSGELGNRMFSYAVIYGLARLNNRSGYIQECTTITCRSNSDKCQRTPLQETFKISLPVKTNLPDNMQRPHEIQFHIRFPEDYNIPDSANVLTGAPWPNSVTHFLHVREEIHKEFTFQARFQLKADDVLSKARGEKRNATLVGIHVRRGDYLKHLGISNKTVAPKSFYEYGMKYFRLRYGEVVFVVTSDDHEWCRKNFQGPDIFFTAASSTPAEDLAILSRCNHTLFDYGTYGLWGAFLAGGEAMYYVDGITDPTRSGLRAKLMYPPEWTGISSKMLETI